MGKKVYIDGNFLLKSGVFYGLDFCMYADESFKDATDEHLNSNEDGIYEVTEDGGSMFDTYFVVPFSYYFMTFVPTYSATFNCQSTIMEMLLAKENKRMCEHLSYSVPVSLTATSIANLN